MTYLGPRGKLVPDMKQAVTEFQRAFIARTKQAREAARLTQKQMGKALNGMAQDTYKNYERIRELPHEHIPTFCLVCHITADWLFDVERGEGEKVLLARGRRRRSTPRKAAAPAE